MTPAIQTPPEKLWEPAAAKPAVRHDPPPPPKPVPAEHQVEVSVARTITNLEQQTEESLRSIRTATKTSLQGMREQIKTSQEWFDHVAKSRDLDMDEMGKKVDLSVDKMRKVLESVESQGSSMAENTKTLIDSGDQMATKLGNATRTIHVGVWAMTG